MADTRSHKAKKGVEQRVEEELVPLVIEDSTPLGMEALVRLLMENAKASERARQKEAVISAKLSGKQGAAWEDLQVEGHRSPRCPKKGQQEVTKPKEGLGQAKPVPVRRVRLVSPGRGRKDTVLDGIVNGRETVIVLDTGTAISVVPEEWVEKELETGEEVPIAAFGSEGPVFLPVAKVQFKVKHLEWEEEVALAPTIEGQATEVLCRWNLRSDIGFALVSLVREREEEQKDEAVGADEGVMAADRPVKTPESVPPVFEDFESETDEKEEEEENSFAAEETEVALLADEKKEKELFCLKPKGREDNDLVVPPVGKDSSHRAELVEEVCAAATEDIFEEEDLRPSLAEEKDDDLDLVAEVEEVMVELVAEEKEEEHSLAEGAFILKKFGQDIARRSSVLSPWNINVALSVVEWTEEKLQVFRDILVSLGYFCIFTISSEEDVFVLLLYFDVCGPGGDILYFDEREEKEQGETDELRAAPKPQLVGGDVGTSPTDDKKIKKKELFESQECQNELKTEIIKMN